MTSNAMSILVLGAGELGTAVLSNLVKHPSSTSAVTVTVLLRQSTITTTHPPKRQELDALQKLGIHFLPGDIDADSEAELATKFSAFHTIIGCTGMYSPPGTQLKLTRAVLASRATRYIPWQFGVDYDIIGRASSQDLFTEQLDVRDLLRGQRHTAWVIVSTGMFMSFLFEDFFGVVSAGRDVVRALGSWENSVTVTDVGDIAKMVAEVVLVETGIKDQVVYTAGETISYGRLAEVVEAHEGREIDRELWTEEKLMEDLSRDPTDGIKKYRVVFAEGKGVSWDPEQTLNVQKNIKLQDVKEWLLRKQENM